MAFGTKRISDLEYLGLSPFQRFLYRLTCFLVSLPGALARGVENGAKAVARFLKIVWRELADLVMTFVNGDAYTRLSYLIMGAGNAARGQYLRAACFFLAQAAFNVYLFLFGWPYLSKLGTLGTVETTKVGRKTVYGDNSFFILLYSLLTIFLIVLFVYLWHSNIRQSRKSYEMKKAGKHLATAKEDLASLLDGQFHKTLLALPMAGITAFTFLPIVFMILVAFTNFDKTHQPPGKLFTWVGLDNFREMFTTSTSRYASTFSEVLTWTLIWAFFATFLNYFLGMIVAIMINKKGIRFKKMWRTILVMTIAIPQFVSLLYVSKMFASDGLINSYLLKWGWIKTPLPFWTKASWARITIICINVWIGIPYAMLICTGILMNIPADLYESARIDGANAFQAYVKITLPYMLFVTGPYLLTSFIGNINNFNVIYLLTQGSPKGMELESPAGYTDLLITWLYKMTVDNTEYRLAAVIGIAVFVLTAVTSLIVYNSIPSVRNEEDFQ